MKNIWYWLVVLIAGFAIFGSAGLVIDEWRAGDICPKILGIPACYIVFVCFAGALFLHFLSNKKAAWGFFFFVGIVTVIASSGTIGELTGALQCPRTAGGTPMCFISLAICLSLLASKISLLRMSA